MEYVIIIFSESLLLALQSPDSKIYEIWSKSYEDNIV